MAATDKQVRTLMEELAKHGNLSRAARKADLSRGAARKYRNAGKLPSQIQAEKPPRDYPTHEDAFAEHWPLIEAKLTQAPGLEGTTLFAWLQREYPGAYAKGQLRTLQRRIRRWRALSGPERDVSLTQVHRPGEALQLDATHCESIGITIAGELFVHMLCICVLPFSNWWWPTIIASESFAAFKSGLQAALWELGGVPERVQVDNSQAATHAVGRGREFNDAWLQLLDHYGVQAKRTAVKSPNQNGDVESRNHHVKRVLKQELSLRGSHDFESIDEYRSFLHALARREHRHLGDRLETERAKLRPLPARRLQEYEEETRKVRRTSTIRIRNIVYSVPSRLIGQQVVARVYEARVEVYYAGVLQMSAPRLHGKCGHMIDYRHVVASLVQKPAAFERYAYREAMYPTTTFRRAYDAIHARATSQRSGDLAYLRILKLAAETMESDVELALELLLDAGEPPCVDEVAALTRFRLEPDAPPRLSPFEPNLSEYAVFSSQEAA